ncbi:hypothetical protein BT69DRAFT_27179 [Atractiella rhizophila]|nr:hypothetical protein BT69DRAFT_27179 [Atractiella rhizophila]
MAQIPKLNSLWTSPSFFLAKASQAADKQQFTLVRQPGKDEGGEGVFVRCSVTGCPFMLDLRPFTIGKFRVEEACHEHSHSVLYSHPHTFTHPPHIGCSSCFHHLLLRRE